MPEATANGGTSRRARLRRAVLRLLIAAGAIVAMWLIAPSSASADEPSGLGDLLGGATDTVGETVGGVTEAVGGVTDTVDQTVGGVAETVEEVAEPVAQITDAATGTVEQVTDVATGTLNQVSETVEEVTDVATGTLDQAAGTLDQVTEAATGAVEDVLDSTTGTVEAVLEAAPGTVEETVETGSATLPGDPQAEPPAVPSRVASGATVWGTGERPVRHDPVPAPTGSAPQTALTSGPTAPLEDAAPDGGATRPGPQPFSPGSPSTASSLSDLGSSQSLRTPTSNQDVGVLATTILIALVLVRWSRREAELRLSPVFLSLPERPG